MAGLLHKKITDSILKAYYAVYNQLGYGFLEKVYQNAMYFELKACELFMNVTHSTANGLFESNRNRSWITLEFWRRSRIQANYIYKR